MKEHYVPWCPCASFRMLITALLIGKHWSDITMTTSLMLPVNPWQITAPRIKSHNSQKINNAITCYMITLNYITLWLVIGRYIDAADISADSWIFFFFRRQLISFSVPLRCKAGMYHLYYHLPHITNVLWPQ